MFEDDIKTKLNKFYLLVIETPKLRPKFWNLILSLEALMLYRIISQSRR